MRAIGPFANMSAQDKFRIVGRRNTRYRNFGTLAKEITVVINPPNITNAYEYIHQVFSELIEHLLTDDVAPQDRIGFTFSRTGQRDIGLSVRRRDQFSLPVLLQLFERCIQSNSQFLSAGPLDVKFIHISVGNTYGTSR